PEDVEARVAARGIPRHQRIEVDQGVRVGGQPDVVCFVRNREAQQTQLPPPADAHHAAHVGELAIDPDRYGLQVAAVEAEHVAAILADHAPRDALPVGD